MTESQDKKSNNINWSAFKYLGEALKNLMSDRNDALILLALKQRNMSAWSIAELTKIFGTTLDNCLDLLMRKKIIVYKYEAKSYFLTETGEKVAKAWIAFVQKLDLSFLPPEQAEEIKEIIQK